MAVTTRSLLLAPLSLALALSACDGATGPEGKTRVVMSQGSAVGARFSVSASDPASADRGGDRTAVLALVDSLNVTITAVQAQPAQYIDSPDDDRSWVTMTFAEPSTVDLLSLPSDSDGLEVARGDLPEGAYVRLRFLVSEATLTLRAPLTMGRRTFPAGEPIPLRIPSAWVRVPGAYFTVPEGEGAVVRVVFDPATSLGQLVVGGDGRLTLTPVLRGEKWRSDNNED